MSEQQLARRSAILATAREMIAELGYEALTVRDLARRCRVSVPTLYNQFGGKDELLAAAIEEHFGGMLGLSNPDDAADGFCRFINILDQCSEQFSTLSAYHRRLLEAFASLDATATVQRRIAAQFAAVVAAELAQLQAQRQLADWVSLPLLAGQITNAVIGTAVIWSTGHLPGAVLPQGIRYAAGLVLLGVARGQTRKRLEALVIESQAALPEGAPQAQNPNHSLAIEA